MRINIWCDSGANIHSKNETTIDLEELGYTEEGWKELSDTDRSKAVFDFWTEAGKLDWGYEQE